MIAGGLGEEGVFGGEERGPFGGSTRPGDSERCRAQASRSAMARTWSSLFTPCPAAGRGRPVPAYLVGLCACATVSSVYRNRTHWPKLAAAGLPVAAVTALLGLLQLP